MLTLAYNNSFRQSLRKKISLSTFNGSGHMLGAGETQKREERAKRRE